MKKNLKDLSKEEIQYNKKMKRIIKNIAIGCGIVVLVEFFIIFIMKNDFNRNNTFYDVYSSVKEDNDNYILTGSSQFRFSKFNDWESGYEKAKFVKMNSSGKILFESTFTSDFNSLFYSSVKLEDGYVAVGYYEKEEEKAKTGLTEGLIVKYDLDGKKVWNKEYQVLGDTVFTNAIFDDGIIVVGQSIYENEEIGNHPTGGGIIVKYDLNGDVLWFNNYGGNKSGIFNSIVKVNDGYVAVGKDAVNVGMLVKFDFDGNILWSKNYKYMDNMGFTSVVATSDNYILATGAKEERTDIYDGLVVKYDLNGNFIEEYILDESLNVRFNQIINSKDGFVVCGYKYVVSMNTEIDKDKASSNQDAIIVKYDINGNIINKASYGDIGADVFNDMILKDDKFVVAGYSNSKIKGVKSNGKDYFGRIVVYNNNLEKVMDK